MNSFLLILKCSFFKLCCALLNFKEGKEDKPTQISSVKFKTAATYRLPHSKVKPFLHMLCHTCLSSSSPSNCKNDMFTPGEHGTSLMTTKSLKTPKTRDKTLSMSNRFLAHMSAYASLPNKCEYCSTYDKFRLGQKEAPSSCPDWERYSGRVVWKLFYHSYLYLGTKGNSVGRTQSSL